MEGDGSQATSGGTPNDSQHDPGKMFIGGLSWQTSPDSLRDYFTKFGEIRECMVMRDPTTKRSRGFGFVTYVDAASVDNVLAQQHHELDSKTIDPKVAFPRRAQPKMVTRTKKIFVGGLSANTVVEDVKQYFEQFGKVEDAMLMFDKTTNRHRGRMQEGSAQGGDVPAGYARQGQGPALHHGRLHAGDGHAELPKHCSNVWPWIHWFCPELQLPIPWLPSDGLWTGGSSGSGGSAWLRVPRLWVLFRGRAQ
eukprot:XP_014018692.1 PREDICTED: RNA-binding protein Musashi homolog 2-like isoform X2 [Salmo salar]